MHGYEVFAVSLIGLFVVALIVAEPILRLVYGVAAALGAVNS